MYVFEPDPAGGPDGGPAMDAHAMTPEAVLGLVHTLGAMIGRVTVVGCEPADVSDRMGLSPPVAAAVEEAVRAVREILTDTTERV